MGSSTRCEAEALTSYRSEPQLRDAVAEASAIERLESTPVDARNELAAKTGVTRFEPREDGGASLASDPYVGPLLQKGFRYLGIERQKLGYFGRFSSHCLVHPDGLVWVTIRTEWRVWFGASRYFLTSLFDDGTCIETCASPEPMIKASARYFVRPGTNDIAADLESHLHAVKEHVRGPTTPRILPAHGYDDLRRQHDVLLRHSLDAERAEAIVDVKKNEMETVRMFGPLAVSIVLGVIWVVRVLFWGN